MAAASTWGPDDQMLPEDRTGGSKPCLIDLRARHVLAAIGRQDGGSVPLEFRLSW